MAISCDIPISCVSQTAFDEVDAEVMKCTYASQNHFGRLCEEQVYENDVKARLKAEGFSEVHSQIGFKVSHGGFVKKYRLDLVVNEVVYELKAKAGLESTDEAQVLNYAALLGLDRMKLINFGESKVIGRLIGTPFSGMDRRDLSLDRSHWTAMSAGCENLIEWIEGFARSVGGYLRSELYDEALIWFCGGHDICIQRLPVSRSGLELGHQTCRMHSDNCAFVVTSMKSGAPASSYHRQLKSLLSTLPIQAIQWINIHHSELTFTTVKK